ncbi:WG repeat-containing protein [Chitinophaga silvatica]|uniref:WG repeat-containing protein n=1 Tax=Chitinophaga silvatica TaxID=2282649 RepID=A0A3E1YGC5_9BACT|nr:WG repeat-containing protein [Chitinophaga silvatica]RFS26428.1 WG repeat-containing protein [Chitinophaga silvatica]
MKISTITATLIVAVLCLTSINTYSQVDVGLLTDDEFGPPVKDPQLLVPFLKGKLWGYTDVNKRMIIEPKFDKAGFFLRSTSLYFANGVYKGKNVLIYEDGKFVNNDYADGNYILDGGLLGASRAATKEIQKDFNLDKDGLHGYTYDTISGILTSSYYYNRFIRLIEKGKQAIAENKYHKVGLVEPSGKVIIPFEYDEFIGAAGGRRELLILQKNRKQGVVDFTGKVVLPFEYDEIKMVNTYGTRLLLTKYTSTSKESILVSAAFKKVFDGVLTDASFDDKFIMGAKDGKYGYLNDAGEIVIPFIYKQALLFGASPAIEGFALVTNMKGISYFINEKGIEYYSEK